MRIFCLRSSRCEKYNYTSKYKLSTHCRPNLSDKTSFLNMFEITLISSSDTMLIWPSREQIEKVNFRFWNYTSRHQNVFAPITTTFKYYGAPSELWLWVWDGQQSISWFLSHLSLGYGIIIQLQATLQIENVNFILLKSRITKSENFIDF